MNKDNNIDEKVVSDFGKEWQAFNHKDIDNAALESAFNSYFDFLPFEALAEAEGRGATNCRSPRGDPVLFQNWNEESCRCPVVVA